MKLASFTVVAFAASALAENWSTYPSVPKTASINGFADPIYTKIPKCAQECVKVDTGNTPCPVWDTGCFCVMPQWSGQVAECFAKECKDSDDVAKASSLALSLCKSVGANEWMMPSSVSQELLSAAKGGKVAAATASATSGASSSNSTVTTGSNESGNTGSSTATATATNSSNGAAKPGYGMNEVGTAGAVFSVLLSWIMLF